MCAQATQARESGCQAGRGVQLRRGQAGRKETEQVEKQESMDTGCGSGGGGSGRHESGTGVPPGVVLRAGGGGWETGGGFLAWVAARREWLSNVLSPLGREFEAVTQPRCCLPGRRVRPGGGASGAGRRGQTAALAWRSAAISAISCASRSHSSWNLRSSSALFSMSSPAGLCCVRVCVCVRRQPKRRQPKQASSGVAAAQPLACSQHHRLAAEAGRRRPQKSPAHGWPPGTRGC